MSANSLKSSSHRLGDFFRRMRSRGGHKYAIVATAKKLAIIYYRMVRYKQPLRLLDIDAYQASYALAKIANLERTLKRLKAQAA